MTSATIQSLAKDVRGAILTKHRDNGESFYYLKEDAPSWMLDVIREAHGDFMPNDWSYSFVFDALCSLESADEDDDADGLRDQVSEWADSDTDVYNNALALWLASHLRRGEYVSEALRDAMHGFGPDSNFTIYNLLALGQFKEREDVYNTIINQLEVQAERMAEEAEAY